jgi:hypothetical protein
MLPWDWKNWQTVALACLVIFGPWLVGLAFGPESLVLSAVMVGLLAATMVGVGALVVLGVGLLKS